MVNILTLKKIYCLKFEYLFSLVNNITRYDLFETHMKKCMFFLLFLMIFNDLDILRLSI